MLRRRDEFELRASEIDLAVEVDRVFSRELGGEELFKEYISRFGDEESSVELDVFEETDDKLRMIDLAIDIMRESRAEISRLNKRIKELEESGRI